MTQSQRQMQLNHSYDLLSSISFSLIPFLSGPGQKEIQNFVREELKSYNRFNYKKRETLYYLNQFDHDVRRVA